MGRSAPTLAAAISRAEEELGTVVFASSPLRFDWTRYYREELGEDPLRKIVAFDRWGDSSLLPEIKRTTCRIEVALARPGGPREVNLDPGFLGEHQLVLASTKPRGHRLHLGHGIYGDLMLLRGRAGYEPLPWSYPDYAAEEMRGIFNRLRGYLLEARSSRRLAQ